MKNHIITSVDIGTSSIKGLSITKRPGVKEIEVLAQVEQPVFGMRKGVIIDIDEVSKAIREVVSQLEGKIDERIQEIFININGSHLSSTNSRGTVVVSRADQKISEEDVERVIQAAQTFSLPSNKEILDVFPREFIVDGEKGIKEPVDMEGVRLEVEVLALCVFSPYLRNLTSAVLKADVQIEDIIPSPLAAAETVLSSSQKELGVAEIDIGAGSTGIAVFQEADLVHVAIIPIGSSHITNDIAIGLQTDIEIAERIKKEFGSCVVNGNRKKEKIEISQQDSPLTFSQKTLSKIIEARVSEIFIQIRKELKKVSSREFLPAGIILTGGGAKLRDIKEIAKRELKLPIKIGNPSVIKEKWQGLQDELSFSTACGLILRGVEDIDDIEKEGLTILRKGTFSKVKNFFKNFIP